MELPEETESRLKIQKHKISHKAWGKAVTYSNFTLSNKYLRRAVLSTTNTLLMTIKKKSGKILNWILK